LFPLDALPDGIAFAANRRAIEIFTQSLNIQQQGSALSG